MVLLNTQLLPNSEYLLHGILSEKMIEFHAVKLPSQYAKSRHTPGILNALPKYIPHQTTDTAQHHAINRAIIFHFCPAGMIQLQTGVHLLSQLTITQKEER